MGQDQLKRLLESGIIAVVRRIDEDKVMHVIGALVEGGVTGIEMTMDSPNVLQVIQEAKKKYGDKAVIGAGTVLDAEAAVAAIQAGAEFLFAPTLSQDTIKVAKRYGKIVIPGVFTPTEMLQAQEWGADVVKLFPASVLGPKFIKDVRGPLGHIKMMPTGGIDIDNIADYIQAGAVAAGVGGSLMKKDLIEQGKWDELAALAKAFTTKVAQARA
ncbi:bifunctional 4-hydroxy-2-oxoglutarate aldolase/2-dehydro-3-deoxy-phosphogluconate aldolase [Paenibacillus sp. JCM 10914]|uniref:bifunctional 4-hydroxy-2-oxoglutarate aldolase/2-dehydro-3-deoxy-phosphogluconate aldolase n=1 Tax=Paenibacillus sp. JCM 10914 TaxID=1236974 RepID=UPI0003CC3307|nr:bifunctional 4-hydroxy-2-oxoglutarate aldolase/2-dehydro-3-deoxy-phosphogluconate aldolase [Paenibacillus sp. JCM 10914]GAE07079.1 4-hydroxy-2-oxoglutarate aldolase [Paenibacillus sp. JCM 10914]